MASILDFADRNWPLLNKATKVHTGLYRASGGRIGAKVPGLGARMLLLDHEGAKSGIVRTSPLLYVADGDDLVLIASKGGFPQNPAWFYNLKANPETTVQVGAEKRKVQARMATDEERERLWPKAVAAYSDYETYQRRSKGRKIPMVILEPDGAGAP